MIGRTFNIGDIVKLVRDAVASYEPLRTWCVDKYDKELYMVVGSDERNEQGEAEAPFVVLVPETDFTGVTSEQLSSSFSLELGVFNPTFEDLYGDSVTEMQGLYEMIEMADHVVNCLRDMAVNCELVIDDIDLQYNSGVFFPLHIGTMTATITTDHLLGNVQQTLGG